MTSWQPVSFSRRTLLHVVSKHTLQARMAYVLPTQYCHRHSSHGAHGAWGNQKHNTPNLYWSVRWQTNETSSSGEVMFRVIVLATFSSSGSDSNIWIHDLVGISPYRTKFSSTREAASAFQGHAFCLLPQWLHHVWDLTVWRLTTHIWVVPHR